MDETPKKVVQSLYSCFLCHARVESSASRVRVFGKSNVDIACLIEWAISVNVSVYYPGSDLFVCQKCYKRLVRFEKTKRSLEQIKMEIKNDYCSEQQRTKRQQKTEVNVDHRCHAKSASGCEQRLPKSLKFDNMPNSCISPSGIPIIESIHGCQPISTRTFQPTSCASYPKYHPINMAWTLPQHSGSYQLLKHAFPSQATASFLNQANMPSAKQLYTPHVQPVLTSTPIKQTSARADPQYNKVKLSVNYPSKPFNKTLTSEYEALGKALIHGPNQRIATAVLKCKPIANLVIEKVLRIVAAEVSGLCSRKHPSLLRQTARGDLVNYDMKNICEEWERKAPIFYSFLMVCSISNSKNDATWLPSVAMAGSILLKQRNTQMNASAAIMSVLMKTKSIEVFPNRNDYC